MAKLTDFGLALLGGSTPESTDTKPSGSTCGSPAYMAPELFSGAEPGQSSDIYSLGMTLYHMLVGEAPLAGESMSATIKAKVNNTIPALSRKRSGLNNATVELFDRMTAHQKAERVDSYAELIESISSVVNQLQPTETKDRRSMVRRQVMKVLTVFGGLVLIAFLATAVMNRDRAPDPRTLAPTGPSVILLDGESLDLQTMAVRRITRRLVGQSGRIGSRTGCASPVSGRLRADMDSFRAIDKRAAGG